MLRALERFNKVGMIDKPPKVSKTTNEHNSILISYLAGTYCYVTQCEISELMEQ